MTLALRDDGPLTDCVTVLAATFAHEPTAVRLCGPDERRRTAWFDATLRTHMTVPGQRTLAVLDGRLAGVAITSDPRGEPTLAAQFAWSARILTRCGPHTLARTMDYIQRTATWKPVGAWTLEFVGVLPHGRGRGIARTLFNHACASQPGVPAFLTTADPRNVALYAKWGFVVSNEAVIAGLPVVGMTRRSLGSVPPTRRT